MGELPWNNVDEGLREPMATPQNDLEKHDDWAAGAVAAVHRMTAEQQHHFLLHVFRMVQHHHLTRDDDVARELLMGLHSTIDLHSDEAYLKSVTGAGLTERSARVSVEDARSRLSILSGPRVELDEHSVELLADWLSNSFDRAEGDKEQILEFVDGRRSIAHLDAYSLSNQTGDCSASRRSLNNSGSLTNFTGRTFWDGTGETVRSVRAVSTGFIEVVSSDWPLRAEARRQRTGRGLRAGNPTLDVGAALSPRVPGRQRCRHRD